MPRMAIHQYHEIIREPRVLNVRILLTARDFNRSTQHPIYLVEIEVTEHRRNYSSDAKDNFCFDRTLRYR